MLEEFRKFISRGNVIDLAVGVIIGAAFTSIVNSLVDDIINPVIGLITGGRSDLSGLYLPLGGQANNLSLEAAREAGAVLAYGSFLTAVINFLIVAFVLFLVVGFINRLRELREKPAEAVVPPLPSDEAVLLGEIRDLLKQR